MLFFYFLYSLVLYFFFFLFFFFNDTATTEIYTLSLHDALPTCCRGLRAMARQVSCKVGREPPFGAPPTAASRRRERRGETSAGNTRARRAAASARPHPPRAPPCRGRTCRRTCRYRSPPLRAVDHRPPRGRARLR